MSQPDTFDPNQDPNRGVDPDEPDTQPADGDEPNRPTEPRRSPPSWGITSSATPRATDAPPLTPVRAGGRAGGASAVSGWPQTTSTPGLARL